VQRLEQEQVNANEIADKLEQGYWEGGTREQAATMLRQQQAEYYSLLVNHDKLYAKVIEQQAEIDTYKLQNNSQIDTHRYEPVAWRSKDKDGYWSIYQSPVEGAEPLYTHPADLTDAEIRTIQDMCHLKNVGYNNFIMRFARAILRKANEK